MKIVIDVPEKDWSFVKNNYKETGLDWVPIYLKNEFTEAVYKGTPCEEQKTDKLQSALVTLKKWRLCQLEPVQNCYGGCSACDYATSVRDACDAIKTILEYWKMEVDE